MATHKLSDAEHRMAASMADHMTKKKGSTVSRSKARKILRDSTVKGSPLTSKQKRFFGAKASGK